MIASDVMTRNVISVPPDATVADAVALMLDRGISGLLVVDESGTLAGIVTEGDLLRRDELGTGRRRSWWLRLIASPGRQAADFTRTHGRKVSDVMTQDVISVSVRSPLEEIVAATEAPSIFIATVPVGATLPLAGETVAVKVRLSPYLGVADEEVITVDVEMFNGTFMTKAPFIVSFLLFAPVPVELLTVTLAL